MFFDKNHLTSGVERTMAISAFRTTAIGLCLWASMGAVAYADDLRDVRALAEVGNYREAEVRINKHLKENPDDAEGRFLKGIIFSDQKRFDEAIEVFVSLTEDFPQLPEPYNNLAVLYASRGNYAQARDALLVAIKIHPSYATAHENLADIYAMMATESYEKALKLDKENELIKSKFGVIRGLFLDQNILVTPSEAKAEAALPRQDVAAADEREPASHATTHENLADIYAMMAIESYEKALKLDEGNESAKIKLGVIRGLFPDQNTLVTPSEAKAEAAPPRQDIAAADEKQPKDRASVTVPRQPSATAPPEVSREVLAALNAWAEAWSNRDVEGYFAAYAPTFAPSNGLSLSAWKAQRRGRLLTPKFVEVTLSAPRVTMLDTGKARVYFVQQYRSNTYQGVVDKVIDLAKVAGDWRFVRENTR
uniref:Tetratricopeptide repeat-containing protein n=1 Tax=Candidatus Kentrum sp. FW TaxID=2126338 RepID=A0A450TLE2_9GAMM|nr:MAG: Tetratricopeptide repeat-containing protein [Candidatus Kentron sp. FW]